MNVRYLSLAAILVLAACGRDITPQPRTAQQAMGLHVQSVAPPAMTTMLSPNYDSRKGSPITAIVLHHTAMTSDAASTARFFQDPTSKVSSHYVVDRSGAIIRCVADENRAWHAGVSQMDGVADVNTYSIGIEIANVGDNVEPYPAAQVEAVVQLVAYLAETYNIPMSRLTRHRDICVPVGRKHDTSDNFDEAYVAKAAQALIDGQSMPRYHGQPTPAGYNPRRQTRLVEKGDTWASIGDDVYDAPALGPVIAALNPGVSLQPGVTIKLPTTYR